MSQCDRVLDVLKDRQWHRMEEIHQHAGFMRLNSRVSELRGRGYLIECDKTGGVYRYRLLGEPGRPMGLEPPRISADGSPGSPNKDPLAPPRDDGPDLPSPGPARQLSVFEAA